MPNQPTGDPGEGHGHDDEPIDEPVGFRPPLPPEDRIWRHPSEVAAERARTTTAGPRPVAITRGSSMVMVALSAVIGSTLTLGVVAVLGGFDDETRVVERQVAVQPVTSAPDGDSVAAITERTAPSVAGVYVRRDDTRTVGSAVVVRSDGHLLTSNELVAEADEVMVRLHGDTPVPARLVGSDPLADLAVLRIDADDLEPAAIGTADRLRLGDELVVLGHDPHSPWSSSVDRTIVSALERRLRTAPGDVLHGMILVDNPLGVGAAGGPLLDASGAVVAVSSGLPAAGDDRSYGVATPIDMAMHACDDLIDHGRVRHVWLGVEGLDLPAEDAEALGLAGGASIEQVVPDSPAASAGLAPGDVIVAVDGEPVSSMSELIAHLRTAEPGDEITLEVRRGQERMTSTAVLAEREPA